MDLFFKDGLWLNGLELGLEVFGSECAGVASAAGIGHVEAHLVDLVAFTSPGHDQIRSTTGSETENESHSTEML